VGGKRFAPGRRCFLLGRALRARFLGRLGTLVERALLLAFDNGWWRWWRRRDRRTSLALLALRYREKLADSLVEASKLRHELRILLQKLCELSTLLGIFSSQRLQLVHRRVQITLADLCRSSCPLFRAEAVGTSRAAQP